MDKQECDHLARVRSGGVMCRRHALQTLAGGAVTSVLVLAGCGPGTNPPTPIVTSTPTPWVTPTPAAAGNTRHDETPTEGSLGAAHAAEASTINRQLESS
jgi:hypothetical protein